jgi:hypothetical protein
MKDVSCQKDAARRAALSRDTTDNTPGWVGRAQGDARRQKHASQFVKSAKKAVSTGLEDCVEIVNCR